MIVVQETARGWTTPKIVGKSTLDGEKTVSRMTLETASKEIHEVSWDAANNVRRSH
jgi:hypothetical protein